MTQGIPAEFKLILTKDQNYPNGMCSIIIKLLKQSTHMNPIAFSDG